MPSRPKIVVVMPAYNAAKTLRFTYADLPPGLIDQVILVDDGSSDDTVKIARELGLEVFVHNRNYGNEHFQAQLSGDLHRVVRELGLEVFVHNRNYGYGANQKTCYREALKMGADIVVMVHPDYQYDPKLLPSIIDPR